MKLKLDENLGHSVAMKLRRAGHDVHTVFDQRLVGAEDAALLVAATAWRAGHRPVNCGSSDST